MAKVVIITLLVFVALSNAKRSRWNFIEKGKNKKMHIGTQLAAYIAKSLNRCATDCAFKQYCQSVSYNFETKECLLQSVLSHHHHHQLLAEQPGFSVFDMNPPLDQNETQPVSLCTLLSPCQNNGTCTDGPGVDYTCNCTDGYNGTNCAICCNSEVFKGQNCTITGPIFLLIGGYDGSNALNTMELYDINEPANSRVLNKVLDYPLYSHVSVPLKDKRVVIISGYKPPSYLSITTFFDLRLNQFSAGPLLHDVRSYAAAAVINDVIFFCGGAAADEKSRNTCEKMDMYSVPLEWVYVAPMIKERSHFTMFEYNGYLYAFGGKDFNGVFLAAVERYDPNVNLWEIKASMSEARIGCGAALMNGMIYVCGGSTGWDFNLITNNCERYVPDTDQWFNVAPMVRKRHLLVLAAIDDKLFAFGHRWSGSNTVEWYDVAANNWTMTEPMKTSRSAQTGVVFN